MVRSLLILIISFNVFSKENLNEEVFKQLVELIESDSATQSFIISNDNEIVHEYYGDGYTRNDLATSWSISKIVNPNDVIKLSKDFGCILF